MIALNAESTNAESTNAQSTSAWSVNANASPGDVLIDTRGASVPPSGRRRWLGGLLAMLVPGLPTAGQAAMTMAATTAGPTDLEVWRSPTCGCCGAWIDHMAAAGFRIKVNLVEDTAPTRQRLRMPERLGSCHSAVVGGYVIEGHVPAPEVRRLLTDRPDAIGLAVPGMPVGSPGMEMGSRRDPYDVLLVTADGRATVFASHR